MHCHPEAYGARIKCKVTRAIPARFGVGSKRTVGCNMSLDSGVSHGRHLYVNLRERFNRKPTMVATRLSGNFGFTACPKARFGAFVWMCDGGTIFE